MAYLPELIFPAGLRPVVQIQSEETGEIVSTIRASSSRYQPVVFAQGRYSLSVGRDRPGTWHSGPLVAGPKDQPPLQVNIPLAEGR